MGLALLALAATGLGMLVAALARSNRLGIGDCLDQGYLTWWGPPGDEVARLRSSAR